MVFLEIIFESHAESQIKERNLSKLDVEEAILNPDQIIASKKNRTIAQKVFSTGRLKFMIRAIYVVEDSKFVVISAYKTTNIEKYWVKE